MKKTTAFIKLISTIFLGVIFPVLLIYQSYTGLQALTSDFRVSSSTMKMADEVHQLQKMIRTPNDYNFVSLIYLENINREIMQRKQVMKVTIIQLGYAIMSIGLMLIVLGFEDKEHALSGGWDSFKIDFKTGSTGALVIVIGAIMATLGGVIKNDYSNNGIPIYETDTSSNNSPLIDNINSIYELCLKNSKNDKEGAECFMKSYKRNIIDVQQQ